jgi:hypothetical protein
LSKITVASLAAVPEIGNPGFQTSGCSFTGARQRTGGKPMKPTAKEKSLANHVGLMVEVIYRMDNCSMICFLGRKIIVETADLITIKVSQCAA